MFEIRNCSDIWYKSEDMYDWIHYGKTIIIQTTKTKNILQVMKFNLNTERYEIFTDINKIEYLDREYTVVNGHFEIEESLEKQEPEYTETEIIQAQILLNQQEIIIKQNEHDEVLAAIFLKQQTV